MKMSASQKGLFIAILAFIMAFAIYFLFLKKKNDYLVDNPTPNTYYFKINNGGEIVIAGGQSVKVNLKNGKNNIAVFNEQKKRLYDSSFDVSSVRGLLNIAHQDYYVNRQYYGYGLNKDSLIMSMNKVIIDGKPYHSDVKHYNKLYIEDFYYNVNEDYDAVIKNIQKIESRTKIFRKQDFIDYYKENINL
ncbi:hypothetical protein [Riemerella columbipharyngis]|uniref:Uncharacterized protein n=1 Tax=Riemerella columbipharyngis TaxID=1071918 RepID=A0A1G7DQH1_9FLAO|nr:hypothetical protein [Riemerella columbipharyngis]SDE53709.1 hypothetical protein SAMN05421544_11212 [Riemerella columbipharyngis]